MTLDPQKREAWNGLFDVLRPPPGFDVVAVVGTTYGLSLDALVAALIALSGADATQLAADRVAGVLAATRLSRKVRVFVQAGTLSAAPRSLPPSLAALIEAAIVPLNPTVGVFHPKVWVTHYRRDFGSGTVEERVRVLIGSRNLARCDSFEAAFTIEGSVDGGSSPFASDLAQALERWIHAAPQKRRPSFDLPAVIRRTTFELPADAINDLRLRVQGFGKGGIEAFLPRSYSRLVVIAPFLAPAFLKRVLVGGSDTLILSTAEAFSKLNDDSFELIKQNAHPYVVGEHTEGEDADTTKIDGVHAKIVIADGGKGTKSVTFIGSSNATGEGWGIDGRTNVEAMVELQPGIDMDQFRGQFVFKKNGAPREWISEFGAEDRTAISPDEELREGLTAQLTRLSARELVINFELRTETARISCPERTRDAIARVESEVTVECVPLGLLADEAWQPMTSLINGELTFSPVPIDVLSAFVVLKAKCDGIQVMRMAFAELNISKELADQRDEAARSTLLDSVDSADLLAALVLGQYRYFTSGGADGASRKPGQGHGSVLGKVTLEQVLQAIAHNPDIVRELRLLLGKRTDPVFERFCADLELASAATSTR